MRQKFIATAAVLALGLTLGGVARAQFVIPTGYTFSIAPNSNGDYYPDGGGELTDSVLGLSFGNYSNAAEAGAWVGWVNTAGPTVSVQFGTSQTFSRIEIGTTRHDGAAVGLPTTVTIAGTTYNFTSGAMTDNTRNWLVFDGTFTTTDNSGVPTLSLTFGASHSQWLMLDEVRFTAIPESGTVAAVMGALALGTAITARRRMAGSAR